MARYNAWQSRSHVAAVSTLDEAARRQDRCAFFSSIAATLNHILGDDLTWLARLTGDEAEALRLSGEFPYTDVPRDWNAFRALRVETDVRIAEWAAQLTEADIAQSTRWLRGDEWMETPAGFNIEHMMNHQTHHRGQVHAILTAAGAEPVPTDLQVLLL
ncbi:MAG: DinB family protein [Rhodobacteraceae bacterium]|nr:DinB family protein [Paracoccaceae bacterium]